MTKIEQAKREYIEWTDAIGINSIEKLNTALREGRGSQLVNLCEARQERRFVEIASAIYEARDRVRIMMLSGPSSSGKTSSSRRIAQQLMVLGLKPKVIELDNYFVDRELTPRDENGEYDFEALEAMNVKLLCEHLNAMMAGEEVELPKFDFAKGCSGPSGKRMRLDEGEILVMEGIHALNPALTPGIDRKCMFMVYVSALTALHYRDNLKRRSTSDKRLLRRIVRDSRTRGISPEDNILRWASVRRGEEKNIFPYEENADIMFNSSVLYDLPLLKYYAEPLLYGIRETSPAYEKARFLLGYLSDIRAFTPAEIALVPPTSIMREFIGGQML